MSRLRLAVVGAGHLGSIHARLLQSIADVELVGVVDPVASARQKVAADCNVPGFAHVDEIANGIDAAIVAAPTNYHHAVGMDLLNRGIHLLIEKPITTNLAEADELIAIADAKGLTLQVGHVERFNPALIAAQPHTTHPKYIEAVRAGGYTFRSTDVGVVLDLMIHDLDVVLSLVDARVAKVDAMGLTVMGPHEDIARARLVFENGCVADLSASRVSFATNRSMQIYSDQGYSLIDFANRSAKLVTPSQRLLQGELDVNRLSAEEKNHLKENLFTELLPLAELDVEDSNAILEEQRDFVACIRTSRSPRVTGQHGRDALAVAEMILDRIALHSWNGAAEGPVGPEMLSSVSAFPMPLSREESLKDLRKAG